MMKNKIEAREAKARREEFPLMVICPNPDCQSLVWDGPNVRAMFKCWECGLRFDLASVDGHCEDEDC